MKSALAKNAPNPAHRTKVIGLKVRPSDYQDLQVISDQLGISVSMIAYLAVRQLCKRAGAISSSDLNDIFGSMA